MKICLDCFEKQEMVPIMFTLKWSGYKWYDEPTEASFFTMWYIKKCYLLRMSLFNIVMIITVHTVFNKISRKNEKILTLQNKMQKRSFKVD